MRIKRFNEISNNIEKISDIIDDTVIVYEDRLRSLFIGIGEGIDGFDYESISLAGKSSVTTNEYQNEINITFIPNAWGGIENKEFSKVESILDELIGEGGFIDYTIDTYRNKITLDFGGDFKMEIK